MKGTSIGAISKLASDTAQRYDHALSLLKGVSDVAPQVITYLSLSVNLWKAVTLKLVALDYYEKG